MPISLIHLFFINNREIFVNKQKFIGDNFENINDEYLKIAIVGSSSVSGSVNLKEYYSYTTELQEIIDNNQKKIKIMNFGIDGGERTLELFNTVKYKTLKNTPQIILLDYCLPFFSVNVVRESYKNYTYGYPLQDQEARKEIRKMIDLLDKHKIILNSLYNFFTIRLINKILSNNLSSKSKLNWYIQFYETKIFIYGNFKAKSYTIDESVGMLTELMAELKEQNIKFYLLSYANSNEISNIPETYNLPLISLNLEFNEEDHFKNDDHWNKSGCQKVAKELYLKLENLNLFQDSCKNRTY